MNDDRFNDLALLMNIHRDILETVKPTKVLKAFIDKNPREVELKSWIRPCTYVALNYKTEKACE